MTVTCCQDADHDNTGTVTVSEARAALSRFNASHFRATDHEHARYSIPADPLRDDDIRLGAFIRQSEQLAIDNEALHVEVATCHIELAAYRATRCEMDRLTRERDTATEAIVKASPGIAAAFRALEALSDAIDDRMGRPGESYLERVERIEKAFHAATGMLAPGKDYGAHDHPPSDADRRAAWNAWADKRNADLCRIADEARAVLAGKVLT